MRAPGRAMKAGLFICLCATAMAGAALEMRLPALKKYYLDTTLVSNGAATAVIVAPDAPGYADLVGQVRDAVKKLTGADLPVISDAAANAELDQAGGDKRAMVVLGNLMTSKVSARLYVMEQLDVDAGWPGEGGHLVQTVHDPMGDGRNFISLGGSDLKGVQAAARVFIGLLKPEGRSLKVGRLFKLESRNKGPAPIGKVNVNRKGYGTPEAAGRHAVECGFILRKFRTPGYGRMFRHAVERLAIAFKNDEKWEELFPSCGYLPFLWDIIEECEQFDEEDPADAILQGEAPDDGAEGLDGVSGRGGVDTRTFISDTLHVYAQMLKYAKQDTGDQGAGGNNHHADSALYAGLYFKKYYPDLEIGGKLVERMDRYFASPIKCWRASDNAMGYADATWYANLQYSLLRPDMKYFSSGMVRKAADYHIVITSNCGRSGGFGDSLTWSKTQYLYHPVLLNMAAWYYRDGSYLWWFKKCGGKPGSAPEIYYGPATAGRYCVDGLDEQPPVRWLGVKPYPLDHWMYRDWKAPQPEEEHAHRYFDKMSYRAGFDATNQYMLISGFCNGYHGHPDANAIVLFSDNGCDFIDDSGYMQPDITEHNTLIIDRKGIGAPVPGLARIDNMADLGGVAFTETSVSGYNGAKWSRNIVWEKEAYFAILDEVEAEEDGDFGFNCVWRPQGDVALNGRELTALRGTQAMRLVGMGGNRQKLDRNKSGFRLFQTWTAEMKKGQKTTNANLILVDDRSDTVSMDAEGVAPGVMLVKRGGEFTLLGIGPCSAVAGLDTDAALFHAGPGAIHACGCTRLSAPGFDLRSDKPVSVFLDLGKGTGLVEAIEAAHVVLATGTETALDAGKGSTAIRFAPVSAGRLAERIAPLAGLFDATAAARRDAEARATAAQLKEQEALKSRLSVIWECRDFVPAGGRVDKTETRDFGALLEEGETGDLGVLVKSAKEDGLAKVEATQSQTEGLKEIRWLETADRDGDGKSEILVAQASGYVASLSHDGTPRWSAPTVSSPGLRGISGGFRAAIGPPGDRKLIVASGHESWFLSCIDADGRRLWESPLPAVPADLYASDPNTNGEFEIGVAAFEYAYGFSHQGRQLWKKLNQEKHASTCGAAYDLDGDGASEMVVGNDYYFALLLNGRTGANMMKLVMTWHAGPSAVAMGDLDGDGTGDMVLGDRMGYVMFCTPWNTGKRGGQSLSAIVTFVKLADIEGDGRKEVFVGADSGIVYVFDCKAGPLFHCDVEAVPRGIDFGDMDGNGRLDLLVVCSDNSMRILDDKGRKMAMFSVDGGVKSVRAAELDGNRKASECVVAGDGGCVYALKLNAAPGE